MITQTDVNLCEEILKEMLNLEFSRESIEKVKSEMQEKNVPSLKSNIQKVLLTTLFFKILISSTTVVPPTEIRLALNSGNSYVDWLQDFKLVILPFLKENEDKFF